ncbi:MAG: hypothetical protein IT289_09930, partial [Oligoflexia bacterium]|nr:hypothetical protein [Oligoflexia bacterium]
YFLEFASKGGSVFHEKEVSYDKSTSGAAKIFTGVLETVNLLIVLQWEPEVSGYYGFINYGSGNAERLICREVIDVY